MITLFFLFAFGFAAYLSFQAVFRKDAHEEILRCARLRKKAEEATEAADVRAPAKEARARAESIYSWVKWAPDGDLAWLRGNFKALRAAGEARSEFQDSIRLAEADCSLARHVRGTLSAVKLQIRAFERALAKPPACPLPSTEVHALVAEAEELLVGMEYEQAEAKAMQAFRLLAAYADQCFERRTICVEVIIPRAGNPPGD